jgi:hypothetical protein
MTEQFGAGATKAPEAPADPVAARLAQLEADLQAANDRAKAQEAAVARSQFNGDLSALVSGTEGIQFPGFLRSTLERQWADGVTRRGDSWLLKDGKTLAEAYTAFMASPEGKHFQKAPAVDGLGGKTPTDPPTSTRTPAVTGVDIAQAFGV